MNKRVKLPVALEAQMRTLLREFVNWQPSLHYERDTVSGERDDGPYVQADHVLALQRRAKNLLGV